jgi:hypothetical protein
MPNRTDGIKNGNQTWIDFLCYEQGHSMLGIAQAKQERMQKVNEHLGIMQGEKLEGVVTAIGASVAMIGGTLIGAVPLMSAGALGMLWAGFSTAGRTQSQVFAEKEAQFLRLNGQFLNILAALEQRGEIPTLDLADMYNQAFALCTRGGDALVVDQEMVKGLLAAHANNHIGNKQAAEGYAAAMSTGTPIELPHAADEPFELSPPEPPAYAPPVHKHDLLSPAIDVHAVTAPPAPAVDRLDPAQMMRDVAAGAVAGSVLGGGYPQPPIGVEVITPIALNNVTAYPFIMVVAGQGNGKTVTMAHLMTVLSGHKALSTPKANDHKNPALSGVYDLRFGFNPSIGQGQYFGDVVTLGYEAEDLDHLIAAGSGQGGTVLDFIRGARQTANRRTAHGKKSSDQPWRLFYDEASKSYSLGFAHLEDKQEKACKREIELTLKYGMMDFRASEIQLFVGCQSETVESIGMKNISAVRDEAWHLYPGPLSIEKARMLNQPNIAAYLERLISAGYAIALLEKQGVIFKVLQLPKLSELAKYDPIVDADEPQAIHTTPTAIEAPANQQPTQVIPQGEQMAQMMQAVVASGVIPDPNATPAPQNDFAAMFSEMKAMNAAAIEKAEKAETESRRLQNELQRMRQQITDQNFAARQSEIETDEEYGAIDPEPNQPVMSPAGFDPISALEDTLNGLKQEAELQGKSNQPVVLTTREFSRAMAVSGTEYDGSKTGGSAKVRELFQQYAFNHSGTYRVSVVNEGLQNESWRLTSISPTIKSTASKAVRVKKR